MKKLFRSCTALMLALCLVLGVCGTGVMASAAEVPEITKESLVDWAKEILDRLQQIDLSKENAVAELKALIAEAKDILARIEAIDVSKENAREELKKLAAEAKSVVERIKALDPNDVITVEELKHLIVLAIAAIEDVANVNLTEDNCIDAAKKLAKEAKDILDRLSDVNFREELTAANLEEMIKEIVVKAEQKIAEAEDFVARKEAELKESEETLENLKAELEGAGVTVEEAKAALKKIKGYIATAKKAVAELKACVEIDLDDTQPILDKLFNLYDATAKLVNEGCNAAARDLQTALYELAKVTAAYVRNTTGKSSEALEQKASEAKAELDAMYIAATQTTLQCIDLSNFVALGDADAYGPAADQLHAQIKEYLGKQPDVYKNLTVAGQTAAQLRADLDSYKADLAEATLITISFDTNTFAEFAFEQVTNHTLGLNVTCDWGTYVGEANAAYVEELKAELHEELEQRGYDNIPALMVFAESYAFAYAQHIMSYYPLVRDIHGMNPEACIVMVGMHNSLEGVVSTVGGVKLPVGDFMRYLTDVSNIYSLAYAMLSENKVYVDTFGVEVNVDTDSFLDRAPTDAGYAEIADSIWNALGVQDHVWELREITEEHEWHECAICGYDRYVEFDDTGDMIGVVVALLAVTGLGITVLKKKEF